MLQNHIITKITYLNDLKNLTKGGCAEIMRSIMIKWKLEIFWIEEKNCSTDCGVFLKKHFQTIIEDSYKHTNFSSRTEVFQKVKTQWGYESCMDMSNRKGMCEILNIRLVATDFAMDTHHFLKRNLEYRVGSYGPSSIL